MSTKKIADFTVGTLYHQIPEQAIRIAKKCILDTVGVALAGSKEAAGEIVTNLCRDCGGQHAASVIGGGFKTSTLLAALANGTMAHTLDYDDISKKSLGHSSAVLMPVALALAEDKKMSGKDVLVSFIIGYEIATRVGDAMGSQFFGSNWHTTPVTGSIGATAAAARILGLNTHQSEMALGIVSSLAGGLRRNFGTMTKPLHVGNAARNGIMAALLAGKGFTASPGILEGNDGFCSTFYSECDTNKLGEGLGEIWDIITEVIMKAYPCCGGSHGAIDAILDLRKKHGFSVPEVLEIQCQMSPMVGEMTVFHSPQTVSESRFSTEYAVAIALIDGEVSVRQFNEQKLNSPLTHGVMNRVKCFYREEFRHGLELYHAISVKLANGNEYSRTVKKYKGTTDNPLSDGELSAKFKDCASLVLKTKDMERALDLLWHLEELENITELMELVCLT